jgi:hypothetical protein
VYFQLERSFASRAVAELFLVRSHDVAKSFRTLVSLPEYLDIAVAADMR